MRKESAAYCSASGVTAKLAGSNMQALDPGGKVEKGNRFPEGRSAKELADWASKWL